MKNEDSTIRKSIGFNIEDPDERTDLEHALKRKNFSRYVKQLIHLDRVAGRENLIESNRLNIQSNKDAESNNSVVDEDVISRSSGGFL